MKKFTSIEQYRHVVKSVQLYFERTGQPSKVPTLHFTGTCKLHGTNAGLRRKNGKFQPQSREQIISPTCDNAGFAAFIETIPEDELHNLFNLIEPNNKEVTLFGEWVGPGIQKGTGINQLPNKQWVIFGAWVEDEYVKNIPTWQLHEHDIYNILEVDQYHIEIDFKQPALILDKLEELTREVEERCPWAYSFGITGVGEGIIWTCDERPHDSSLFFKTKGDKHKTNKQKKVATIDVEKLNSINECVDFVLPQRRLEQGLEWMEENHIDLTMPNLGKYLQWVGQDVKKEESDTIKENGLNWKEVSKYITLKAKEFYIAKYNEF